MTAQSTYDQEIQSVLANLLQKSRNFTISLPKEVYAIVAEATVRKRLLEEKTRKMKVVPNSLPCHQVFAEDNRARTDTNQASLTHEDWDILIKASQFQPLGQTSNVSPRCSRSHVNLVHSANHVHDLLSFEDEKSIHPYSLKGIETVSFNESAQTCYKTMSPNRLSASRLPSIYGNVQDLLLDNFTTLDINTSDSENTLQYSVNSTSSFPSIVSPSPYRIGKQFKTNSSNETTNMFKAMHEGTIDTFCELSVRKETMSKAVNGFNVVSKTEKTLPRRPVDTVPTQVAQLITETEALAASIFALLS